MVYFAVRGRFKKLKSVVKGILDGFIMAVQSPEKWP
jgi:hypothetical protein